MIVNEKVWYHMFIFQPLSELAVVLVMRIHATSLEMFRCLQVFEFFSKVFLVAEHMQP